MMDDIPEAKLLRQSISPDGEYVFAIRLKQGISMIHEMARCLRTILPSLPQLFEARQVKIRMLPLKQHRRFVN